MQKSVQRLAMYRLLQQKSPGEENVQLWDNIRVLLKTGFSMVLPFQTNLIKAQEAYEEGDFEAAASYAAAFLRDLDESEQAAELSLQAEQKSTFFPNSVSVLMVDQLNALFLLAERYRVMRQAEKALYYCREQLKIFDRHYGRSPSKSEMIALEVPGNPLLTIPFARTAWCFANIYAQLHNEIAAAKWRRLFAAASADFVEPESTWEGWVNQPDIDQTLTDPSIPDPSWTITDRGKSDQFHRIRLRVDLATVINPAVHNRLITLSIPTRSRFPVRSELWELWAIRNAAEELLAPDKAVLFCEEQTPDLRSLFYYAAQESAALEALELLVERTRSHAIKLASEPDPDWSFFKHCGGSEIETKA